jgi:hypothetical protein
MMATAQRVTRHSNPTSRNGKLSGAQSAVVGSAKATVAHLSNADVVCISVSTVFGLLATVNAQASSFPLLVFSQERTGTSMQIG